MTGRNNVTGGESSVHTEDGDRFVTTTLSEPGEILLSDGCRTLHGVSALRPEENEDPGHSDVLITACTSF
ncbi:MAG TPA: 2OG-Fe dioxygenase family protein [Streptomyces sp.]|nr:2OG-Fe dioxygenase family protein [Streptomyces sp.]